MLALSYSVEKNFDFTVSCSCGVLLIFDGTRSITQKILLKKLIVLTYFNLLEQFLALFGDECLWHHDQTHFAIS